MPLSSEPMLGFQRACGATLSNCRDLSPRPLVPPLGGNSPSGTAVKVAGTVKIQRTETIGSQALREFAPKGAVHRLDGSGFLAFTGPGLKI